MVDTFDRNSTKSILKFRLYYFWLVSCAKMAENMYYEKVMNGVILFDMKTKRLTRCWVSVGMIWKGYYNIAENTLSHQSDA